MECIHSYPFLLLAFGNLPHHSISFSLFQAQFLNKSPGHPVGNFQMDHLKSVWKDAPAITRSFTVIPLVLHIAGWRWFQQLKLGFGDLCLEKPLKRLQPTF